MAIKDLCVFDDEKNMKTNEAGFLSKIVMRIAVWFVNIGETIAGWSTWLEVYGL